MKSQTISKTSNIIVSNNSSSTVAPASANAASTGYRVLTNKSALKKHRKKRNKNTTSTDITGSLQQVKLASGSEESGFSLKQAVSTEAIEAAIFDLLRELLTILNHPDKKNLVGSPMPNLLCPGYRRSLKGFTNFKNSCYLSACIQALFSLPPFLAILDHISVGLHRFFGQNGSLQACWLSELALNTPLLRLLVLLLDQLSPFQPDGSSLLDPFPIECGYIQTSSAIKLDQNFVKILTFEESHQQDAADCISKLLTQLHEEMIGLLNRHKKSTPVVSPRKVDFVSDDNDDVDDDSSWTKVGTKGKKFEAAVETKVDSGEASPVSCLFGGLLVSRSSYNKMTRVADKSSSSIRERFFVLSLDIKNDQVHRIEDSLTLFSKGETISDFRDPDCGECVVMSRRIYVDHLPPVLLVQLNRFYFASSPATKEFGVKKVLKGIPVYKTLNIREDIVSKERAFSRAQGTYRLHAVIFHVGYQANRGHYTCSFIHEPEEDDQELTRIFYFDDEHVFSLHGAATSADLKTILGTHRPFDTRSGRFGIVKPENGSTVPSIAEQPRTPYILVYTSCFRP